MRTTGTTPIKNIVKNVSILILTGITSNSFAVIPSEDTFKFAIDVQGQRINIYNGCSEGRVTCDDLLVEAPNLNNLSNVLGVSNTSLASIKYYPMQTKHSICKDGVTPCGFQGYIFESSDIKGFVEASTNQISITFKALEHTNNNDVRYSYSFLNNYQPLIANKTFIDTMYEASDRDINEGFKATYSELKDIYGINDARAFRHDQIKWVIKRSKDCGADKHHLPRNDIEKACFIEHNTDRSNDYFLWID